MNVIFLGSGVFGVPTLEMLARHHRVSAVVTQPDRPAGRGKVLTPTPVGAFAAQHLPGVPIFKPENVNEAGVLSEIRKLSHEHSASAWVVIAFGQKLSPALLDGVFAINLHASLLPRWRGAAPINAAILAGDTTTGNSVISLADRMDAGLIYAQSHRAIEPLVTAGELHDQLSLDGPALVRSVLEKHHDGTLVGARQDESLVTKAGKLKRADAQLDFHRAAHELRQRVHGLTPWPGVSVDIHGRALKLLRVQDTTSPKQSLAGVLIDADAGIIACGHASQLQMLEVQPAGGKAMKWGEYRRGAGRTLSAGVVVSTPSPAGSTPE